MIKRFDFIYEIITAITSVFLVILFVSTADSNILSLLINYFSNDSSSAIYAQEYINRIFYCRCLCRHVHNR